MNAAELKACLKQLNYEISLITSCRTAYFELWPSDERVVILNRYKGFFWPTREALRQTMLMATSRIVDTDNRTIGIPVIVNAIRCNPELLPHASDDLLGKLENRSAEISETVVKLTKLRNRRLAHWDRGEFELPPIEKQEMDRLIEQSKELFNDFSSAFDRSVTSWQQIAGDAERHTKLLFDDANKGFQERQKVYEKLIEDTKLKS
ncbi:MAG: hypothetical protein IH960_09805 [Chloroflexi bacterium]|nr:hypothetical protein [Chloroflexota bacterium]